MYHHVFFWNTSVKQRPGFSKGGGDGGGDGGGGRDGGEDGGGDSGRDGGRDGGGGGSSAPGLPSSSMPVIVTSTATLSPPSMVSSGPSRFCAMICVIFAFE